MEAITKRTLRERVGDFIKAMESLNDLLCIYNKEFSDDTSDEEVTSWKMTLGFCVDRAMAIHDEVNEKLRLSLINNDKDKIRPTYSKLSLTYEKANKHCRYNDDHLEKLLDYVKANLIDFYSNMSDEDYMRMYNAEWERYKADNLSRIELIYNQDFKDIYGICYEDERRARLCDERKKELMTDTPYGEAYHDFGRNERKIAEYIFTECKDDSSELYSFFQKKLSYEYAVGMLQRDSEDSEKVNNLVFHENLQVKKIFDKLSSYIEDRTLYAQKHWYIVYCVFKRKKWLTKTSQVKFRDQVNAVFAKSLKCSSDDFSKIESYYKHHDYSEWKPAASDAPAGCQAYKNIADTLDNEFVDNVYVIPGKILRRSKS